MSEVLRLIKEAAAQKAAQEKPKGLRVAAYCRVSTDSDEQKNVLPDPEGVLHGYDTAASGLDVCRNLCG